MYSQVQECTWCLNLWPYHHRISELFVMQTNNMNKCVSIKILTHTHYMPFEHVPLATLIWKCFLQAWCSHTFYGYMHAGTCASLPSNRTVNISLRDILLCQPATFFEHVSGTFFTKPNSLFLKHYLTMQTCAHALLSLSQGFCKGSHWMQSLAF